MHSFISNINVLFVCIRKIVIVFEYCSSIYSYTELLLFSLCSLLSEELNFVSKTIYCCICTVDIRYLVKTVYMCLFRKYIVYLSSIVTLCTVGSLLFSYGGSSSFLEIFSSVKSASLLNLSGTFGWRGSRIIWHRSDLPPDAWMVFICIWNSFYSGI